MLADLLERFCASHGAAVTELLLIGHSLGGLVIRSARHLLVVGQAPAGVGTAGDAVVRPESAAGRLQGV
jgi:triacylglycerol esterase/lipase EstA (alpha/beta hydrolase family)